MEILHVAQPRRQIHAVHVGGAVSGGGDAQNGAGVLRGLVGVQAVPVRLRRVGRGGLVVDGGGLAGQQAGGVKPHHRPVAAHRAGGGGILGQQILPGLAVGGLPWGLLPAGLRAAGGEQQAHCQQQGQHDLFHDGAERLRQRSLDDRSVCHASSLPFAVFSLNNPR